jgi:hypothetical protein
MEVMAASAGVALCETPVTGGFMSRMCTNAKA